MNAMNYVWTFCPKCEGQLTLQFGRSDAGLSGSLRRWSRDRSVNDGRRLEVPAGEVAAGRRVPDHVPLRPGDPGGRLGDPAGHEREASLSSQFPVRSFQFSVLQTDN